MKLLFVNPSLRLHSPTKYLPVGIASVMTYVKSLGYEFDLLDIDINDLEDDAVERYVEANIYDVVLTGSIVTHYKWMKWFAKMVKKHHPKTKIIVGNSVAGSIPELFLRNSGADVAIVGEGEFSCAEALNAINENLPLDSVKGIAFINDEGTFVQTPKRPACKIDDLPMIDWSSFDVERYFEKSYAGADGIVFDDDNKPRVMPVSTARGCVFRCTFCHFVFWDDPYRYRSAQSVLAEVRRNIENYGATFINFWDDLSFASLKQAERMADAIIESGLQFHWNAAIRTDLFGKDKFSFEERLSVAKKMRASGCVNVGFSLESGNQDILNMMEKRVDVSCFKENIRVAQAAGLTCSISVVFGYPIETPDTIRETFEQCLDVGIYPSMGFLMPLPYTKMYEYAKQHGYIDDEDYYLTEKITERQDICLNMTKMPSQQILDLVKDYAKRLNDMLKLGLNDGTFIRTGGYRNQRNDADPPKRLIDPDNLERNENDFSLNYSQALFKIDIVPIKESTQ